MMMMVMMIPSPTSIRALLKHLDVLDAPRFCEVAQVAEAALPLGPPSAAMVGVGSTIRRRFRFAAVEQGSEDKTTARSGA